MIAVLGNLSRDLLQGEPPKTGGGPFHAARALARLGADCQIYVRCADEDRPVLVPPLEAFGLPVVSITGRSTATFAMSYEGDRRTMRVDAIGDVWHANDLPAIPSGIEWLQVAALARSDFPEESLAGLARNHRLLYDGQGLVRPATTGPLEPDDQFDRRLLRHITVLKLSDEEAGVIGDPEALGVPEVLLTYGSRGSTIIANGRAEEISADPVAADPTGAGDMFGAAYLVGRAAGASPGEAARRATEVVHAILADL